MAESFIPFGRFSDPNAFGNAFGPSGGKGAEGPRENQVTIVANYNRSQYLQRMSQSGANVPYPSKGDQDQDITQEELVYIVKPKKNSLPECSGTIEVYSSFNNDGGLSTILFPDDFEMQKECILNNKKFIGSSRTNFSGKGGNYQQGVTIQIKGKRFTLATTDMPPGYFAYIDLDKPLSVHRGLRTNDPFKPRDKVTATLRPYTPTTFSNRLMTILKNFVLDKESFEKGMNRDYRTTDSWINFCQTTEEFVLFSGLMMLHTLTLNNVIRVEFTEGPLDLRRSRGEATAPHQLILGMFSAWGMAPHSNETLPQINITEQKSEYWKQLAHEIMLGMFCATDKANVTFGWSATNSKNDYIDSTTRSIQTHKLGGQMLYKQCTMGSEFFLAVADAKNRDNDRLAGKIASSSTVGTTVTIVE